MISDEEVIKDFEENVIKSLKTSGEKVNVVILNEFTVEALSQEEIFEHSPHFTHRSACLSDVSDRTYL